MPWNGTNSNPKEQCLVNEAGGVERPSQLLLHMWFFTC
jgi:hypothetical protein